MHSADSYSLRLIGDKRFTMEGQGEKMGMCMMTLSLTHSEERTHADASEKIVMLTHASF